MPNDQEVMENYEAFMTPESVPLGDNRKDKAYGKGTIALKADAIGKWKNPSLTDVQ